MHIPESHRKGSGMALVLERTELESDERQRAKSLQRLVDALGDAETSELNKGDFAALFALSVRLLELDQKTTARLFKISRPTISRWETGVSAPHPIARPSVFQLLKKVAQEKLRQHSAG